MLIKKYISNVEHIRISIQNLGPAQTDSLLVTNRWLNKSRDVAHLVGIFYFRADLLFKKKFSAPDWVRQGLQEGKMVFPFKVWDDGGPADQLFFLPIQLFALFNRSLEFLQTYKVQTLQRCSLHYLHIKKAMDLCTLTYAIDVVCDANSEKEWNPIYSIVGRKSKGQNVQMASKWGTFWYEDGAA